ncbi:MAG: glutamine-hydrolyzing GMP synthase [Pseudomonadota bacterium]|nr:glutamine-hydrolyzing GMP synthase [Pseudomonadota bacterium]
MYNRILIIDFGSQVTQLIARRIRESGVYSEIQPVHRVTRDSIESFKPKGIILSGGPASASEINTPRAPKEVFTMGLPILGICYGQQTMVEQLGGLVESHSRREFGRASLKITGESRLFSKDWQLGSQQQVWMSHGDRVTVIPDNFRVIGTSEGAPYAAIADEQRHLYGVQFHPEVVHTPKGAELLRNFTHLIADCTGDWNIKDFRNEAISKIKAEVAGGSVICGLSGGVDSSVVAVLLHEAVGSQLNCVFVDTGLMRINEAQEVITLFRDNFKIPLTHVDASDLFLSKLKGVIDPERKRKIIGSTFIDIFEKEARTLGGADFLAQGTLYPDIIESVSFDGGASVTIKSHHNVGGLPDRMKMKLVEPLKELFKDEVRNLAQELGLPEIFVQRHPFPGPGLAIRIPGEINVEKLEILRKADAIFLEEIRKAGIYTDIWQAFAVLLPIRTVGVMGDARTYEFVCALRAVSAEDGMTADFYNFDMAFIGKVANRIINEVSGINRVVYDITSKPPGTIEWE